MFYFPEIDKIKESWPEIVKSQLPYKGWISEGIIFGMQAVTLYEAVIRLNAKAVLELGRKAGNSTRIILNALKITGGYLWSIDKNPGYGVSGYGMNEDIGVWENFTPITADDITYPWSQEVDLIFIDTDHTYQLTKNELEKYWPFVKNPGMLIVHKCDSHFGAKKAVFEFSERNGLSFLFDTRGQGMCIFLKPQFYQLRDRKTHDILSNEAFQ